MTVSKRLRYEVLRRDNHACRYCGATAPDVPLRVDHVLPVALGGSDDPTNLAAACQDCNAGKAASNPDQPLVETVSDDAIRWARAVAKAAQRSLDDFWSMRGYRNDFHVIWNGFTWTSGGVEHTVPLDPNWETSIDTMIARGLPFEVLLDCVRIAMSKRIRTEHVFRYFCGVAWRKLDEIEATAKSLMGQEI